MKETDPVTINDAAESYSDSGEPRSREPFGRKGNVRAFEQRIRGKIENAKRLVEFGRYFSNWKEVWRAYRFGLEFPELRLRTGLRLIHGDGDQPLFSFREIFEEQPYTSDGFYVPKRNHTVLDIGANIGFFAIYLQRRARGIRVHCFEPGAVSRSRLQRNILINNLGAFVSVYPYALSDHNGSAHLSQHVHTIERSLVCEGEDRTGAETVNSITVARALTVSGADNIELLKMDIEGGELDVLMGSRPADWQRVERVAMEYHANLHPGCREKLVAALRERGFAQIRCIPSSNIESQGILQASK
jgi:FkbM family methyltransferase